MCYLIAYELISPAVLGSIIEHQVPNAFCTATDFDEDYCEFSVGGWLPLSVAEVSKIEDIIAPYL